MENDKYFTVEDSDESEEESENGVEVKSTPISVNSSSTVNNIGISRSSSSASLVSSSQTDDHIKNNCYPADELISNDDSEVILEDVDKMITRNLPSVNVPEKIILCIDIAEDPEFTAFKLGSDGSEHTPLSMVKRVADIFMKSKSIINSNHEFALIILQCDTVLWLRDFTKDPCDVMSVLEDLRETLQPESFDLTSLFDTIKGHVSLPVVEDTSITPPPFVLRTILLYSRSYCLPEFKYGRESFDFLTSSPYFTLDTLYIHENPSDNNKCEEIYKVLDSLDEKGFSYVFDVSRNATKLHHDMAKLLAHPLQRPLQKLAYYKFDWQDTQ